MASNFLYFVEQLLKRFFLKQADITFGPKSEFAFFSKCQGMYTFLTYGTLGRYI